jgi:hypothetical protein
LRFRGLLLAALLISLAVAVATVSPRDLSVTIAVVTLLALPLALSVGALLDAARRPEWAWALSRRVRVMWMVAILFGAFVLPLGVAVSSWYLLRIRPELRDAENGRIRGRA